MEIAERADVSVEGVVRVLTREPVSDAIKERVLDVLDDLTPEQTRAVQRFALAALHDVLERPGDADFADQAAEGPLAPDPGPARAARSPQPSPTCSRPSLPTPRSYSSARCSASWRKRCATSGARPMPSGASGSTTSPS